MAWTGIENFRMGRFDPPPPADEPEDIVVCMKTLITYYCFSINFFIFMFIVSVINYFASSISTNCGQGGHWGRNMLRVEVKLAQ